MRNYIFEFKQDKAIEFGLKTNDLLLLDYMLKFFNTDQITFLFLKFLSKDCRDNIYTKRWH